MVMFISFIFIFFFLLLVLLTFYAISFCEKMLCFLPLRNCLVPQNTSCTQAPSFNFLFNSKGDLDF